MRDKQITENIMRTIEDYWKDWERTVNAVGKRKQ